MRAARSRQSTRKAAHRESRLSLNARSKRYSVAAEMRQREERKKDIPPAMVRHFGSSEKRPGWVRNTGRAPKARQRAAKVSTFLRKGSNEGNRSTGGRLSSGPVSGVGT